MDIEETIKEFFRCNIRRDYSDFDFDTFFDIAQSMIGQKLAEHGLTTLEEFQQVYEDIYGENRGDLKEFAVETDYICISEDMIREAIYKYLFEKYRNEFERLGSMQGLKTLYDKLNKIPDDDKERAILFDEVIHAQHETGLIFDDINIEDIKEEIDREFKE